MPTSIPGYFRRSRSLFFCAVVLAWATVIFATDKRVQFLNLADVMETLQLFADSGIPGSNITDARAWDRWIRKQDSQVRGRIDGGVEDSISNLILYGTSYTVLPRFENPESALEPDGRVCNAALARTKALYAALTSTNPNERIWFI